MKLTVEMLLEIIKSNNITKISELESFNLTSKSTLRRRLKELQNDGFIKLNYGGEIELVHEYKISVNDTYRQNINNEEKEELARIASSFVRDNEIIFIDNGTTVRHMFKYLVNKDIEIYTNGYMHIKECEKYNINLQIIPGEILYKEASINGDESISYLSKLKIDRAFVGANGFDEQIITTPNKNEAVLKRFVLDHSTKGYIVADKSKYNQKTKYKIANINEFNLITNQ